MDDSKRIAVAGYRQVLGDGRDKCDSESDAEYSDHGEMWPDETMCTPDMTGANGKSDFSRTMLTAEQANALRAQGRAHSAQEPV
jgi:hypothetical protein